MEELRPRLYEHAAMCFSAPRVMTFLGRRYRENYNGEVKTHWHRRQPGGAVKHWVKAVQCPEDVRQARLGAADRDGDPRPAGGSPCIGARWKQDGRVQWGWFAMNKGVANLFHYARVGCQANTAYLEARLRWSTTWERRSELFRAAACCRPAIKGGPAAGYNPCRVRIRPCFGRCCAGARGARIPQPRVGGTSLRPPPGDEVERRRRLRPSEPPDRLAAGARTDREDSRKASLSRDRCAGSTLHEHRDRVAREKLFPAQLTVPPLDAHAKDRAL